LVVAAADHDPRHFGPLVVKGAQINQVLGLRGGLGGGLGGVLLGIGIRRVTDRRQSGVICPVPSAISL